MVGGPTGRRVYTDIQARVDEAQRVLDRVGAKLQEKTQAVEASRVAEGRSIARLAQVRLAELEAQRVLEGLDGADRQALALLEQRAQAAGDLDRGIEASEAEQARLEEQRVAAGNALDEARLARERKIAEVREVFEATEAWSFQASRTETTTSQAAHAEAKAAQAEQDRIEKGRPYEEGRLFSYLWKRRYRTAEYRGRGLFRFLDGWVARLCHYDRARRDYAMLLEMI